MPCYCYKARAALQTAVLTFYHRSTVTVRSMFEFDRQAACMELLLFASSFPHQDETMDRGIRKRQFKLDSGTRFELFGVEGEQKEQQLIIHMQKPAHGLVGTAEDWA